PDDTVAFAQKLFGADQRFSALARTGSRSYGRSLLDGYHIAVERGYARLVQLDADFSHDPKMVPVLINAGREADVVIGSRYCRGDSGLGADPGLLGQKIRFRIPSAQCRIDNKSIAST